MNAGCDERLSGRPQGIGEKRFPRVDLDVLKVDKSFTSRLGVDANGEVFFRAIITMAHSLGMRVVAEGVETAEQVRILEALQCDELQGFYLFRPVPAEELPHSLDAGPFSYAQCEPVAAKYSSLLSLTRKAPA